jgi:hypothetical protein
MVRGNLFDERAFVLEQNEVVQVVEQVIAAEQAARERFEFAHRAERVGFAAVDGAPSQKPFLA